MRSIATTKAGQLRQKQGSIPLPIFNAIKNGDAEELEKLLTEKSTSYDRNMYPESLNDFKYKLIDLLKTNEDQLTPLQLACSIGNPEMSLNCVEILCESIQVNLNSDDTDNSYKFINYALPGKLSPLHLAVENRATKVISYLIDRNANLAAKSLKGTDALTLICQKVPDALEEVYDRAVRFNQDNNEFRVNCGPMIGIRRTVIGAADKGSEQNGDGVIGNEVEGESKYKIIHEGESECFDSALRAKSPETEFLSYILKVEKWGANLLLHPLVKLFLTMKWDRLKWFFWIFFILESLWLLVYAVAFVQLNLYIVALKNEIVLEIGSESDNTDMLNQRLCQVHILWTILFFVTILPAVKEVYCACVLRRAYLSFENLAQISFIILIFIQFGLLKAGDPEQVAVISTVGIVLSTTLMIFQLGKTPAFGQQVAALKKVVCSCTPHMPVFFVWFLGFSLIFWALLFKSNTSSVIVLLAIVAAMGTGELNAKDHLEESLKRSLELPDIISVFCFLIFMIIIVTLYFNLLIGYAVSDIEVLKPKADAIDLSNRLSTVYTLECFLLSKCGQIFVRMKTRLDKIFNKPSVTTGGDSYLETIYVILPSIFKKSFFISLKFEDIPPQFLKQFKEIAYANLKRDKEQKARLRQRTEKYLKKGD